MALHDILIQMRMKVPSLDCNIFQLGSLSIMHNSVILYTCSFPMILYRHNTIVLLYV